MPKYYIADGQSKGQLVKDACLGYFALNPDPTACKLVVWSPSLGFSGKAGSILAPKAAVGLAPVQVSPS